MNALLTPRVTNSQILLYDYEFDGDFPFNNYFVQQSASIPLLFRIDDELKTSFVDALIGKGYQLLWKKEEMNDKEIIIKQLIFRKDGCTNDPVLPDRSLTLLRVSYNYEEYKEKEKNKPTGVFVEIDYTHYQWVEEVVALAMDFVIDKVKGGHISLVIQNKKGLDVKDYPIKGNLLDIALNYGKNFVPVYNKITERLNETRGKGIVLLHGVPGTGKTSLIKHIATQIQKEVLFIPPALATCIADPSFIDFLMNHSNSVLVIEDAEQVILDREGLKSNAQGVSNILNLTDGIMSDCLGIQVIASFNTSRDLIDKALLRKGRLIAEYKFEALQTDEANALLKHLGKSFVTDKSMTLTDIYNLEEEVNVVQQQPNAIGFSKRY